MIIPCENCGHDVTGKKGYCIDKGKVGVVSDVAGHPNGSGWPAEIKAMDSSARNSASPNGY